MNDKTERVSEALLLAGLEVDTPLSSVSRVMVTAYQNTEGQYKTFVSVVDRACRELALSALRDAGFSVNTENAGCWVVG